MSLEEICEAQNRAWDAGDFEEVERLEAMRQEIVAAIKSAKSN